MGRTQYAILAIGLAGTLMLSLMMKYFLSAADERQQSPVAQELLAEFGNYLDQPPQLEIRMRRGARVAELTITPLLEIKEQGLATQMGEYVWRRLGEEKELTAVFVKSRPWASERENEFDVPCPMITRHFAPVEAPAQPKPVTAPKPAPARPPVK